MQKYSKAVIYEVKKCLIKHNIKFHFDKEEEMITFDIDVTESQRVGIIKCRISFFQEGYTVYGRLRIRANRNNPIEMSAVSDYVNFVNCCIYEGMIELDQRNGVIEARGYVPCQNMKPSQEAITRSICVPFGLLRKFGDGFFDIIWNKATAVECARKYKGIDMDDSGTELKEEFLTVDVDEFYARLAARFGVLSEESSPEEKETEEEVVIVKRKLFED